MNVEQARAQLMSETIARRTVLAHLPQEARGPDHLHFFGRGRHELGSHGQRARQVWCARLLCAARPLLHGLRFPVQRRWYVQITMLDQPDLLPESGRLLDVRRQRQPDQLL